MKLLLSFLILHATSVFATPCPLPVHLSNAKLKQKVQEALSFLGSLHEFQASSMHFQIFNGPVSGKTYCAYLEGAIRNIRFDTDPTPPSSRVAQFEDAQVYVTRVFGMESLLERSVTLIHEARHAVGHQFNHKRCPDPFLDENGNSVLGPVTGSPLAGRLSCDQTAFGGYGMSIIFLRNIQKYCSSKTCTPEIRQEAKKIADRLMVRILDPKAKARLLAD